MRTAEQHPRQVANSTPTRRQRGAGHVRHLEPNKCPKAMLPLARQAVALISALNGLTADEDGTIDGPAEISGAGERLTRQAAALDLRDS